ncbi:histidine phosphatase family protein [Isoptericola sp. NEAU-Y5]|uniref:Histidine phosphatase family protein n=1 Tax=Isoptericola luteus TaxID=2879484 RepID=A0ABS7ZGY2_9MICO|nr:histidine phosphatase family protein [Isoptericola sp. NEAU-Y5]MCA5894278.1 histidine phosphatase family protein [Isoptericola sp. NEAU-Y5]
MRLLLLRHGQTPANVAGLLDTGAPGPALTAVGERQAAAVPLALRDRPIGALAVSSLLRTSLTVAPLAHDRGVRPLMLAGLNEIEAGDLEMSADHADHYVYLGTVFAWARGEHDRRMPGGPDGRAFLGRFDRAVERLAGLGEDVVLAVSHGAAIRSWASARVRGLDVDEVEHTPLANTGLIEAEGDPDAGWRLVDWQREPVGGAHLEPVVADDPTGEPIDE